MATPTVARMTPREILERSRQLYRKNSFQSEHGSDPDQDPEEIVVNLCKDMLINHATFKNLDGDECVSSRIHILGSLQRIAGLQADKSYMRGDMVVLFHMSSMTSNVSQRHDDLRFRADHCRNFFIVVASLASTMIDHDGFAQLL